MAASPEWGTIVTSDFVAFNSTTFNSTLQTRNVEGLDLRGFPQRPSYDFGFAQAGKLGGSGDNARHAGLRCAVRCRLLSFGVGVGRARRGPWLSIAARKMRLMRV